MLGLLAISISSWIWISVPLPRHGRRSSKILLGFELNLRGLPRLSFVRASSKFLRSLPKTVCGSIDAQRPANNGVTPPWPISSVVSLNCETESPNFLPFRGNTKAWLREIETTFSNDYRRVRTTQARRDHVHGHGGLQRAGAARRGAGTAVARGTPRSLAARVPQTSRTGGKNDRRRLSG